MSREKRAADEFALLKLEEDLTHKTWSSRKQGYETALSILGQIDGRSVNGGFVSVLLKAVAAERNVPALEKGLGAILALARNCRNCEDETVTLIMDGVVKRCLSHSKPRIRDLSVQICFAFIEKRKNELVMNALLKNISGQKNQKQVLASVKALTKILKEFGPQTMNVPRVVSKITDLCNDKSTFQQEVKDFLKELYASFGPSLKDHLHPLGALQKKAVEAEFAKVEKPTSKADSKASPKKWIRKFKFRPTSADVPTKAPDSSPIRSSRPFSSKHDESKHAATKQRIKSARVAGNREDAEDLTRSSNQRTCSTLDDTMNMIQSDQWGDRKKGLELIATLLKTSPAPSSVLTSKLIKGLRNIILEDTNVLIVAKAVQCVTALANRKNDIFRQEAPLLMTLLLERFKEKKPLVISSLREATDAIYKSADTQSIIRYVTISLDHKNPSIKSETELLLQRCYLAPNSALLKQTNWRPLVSSLIKNLANQDRTVRENAMAALGTIKQAVGDELVAPYFDTVLKHQVPIIEKYSQNAVIKYQNVQSYEERVGSREKGSEASNYSSEESLLPQRGSSDNSVVSKLNKITMIEPTPSDLEASDQDRKSHYVRETVLTVAPRDAPPVTKKGVSKRSVSAGETNEPTRRPRPLSSSDQDKLSCLRNKIKTLRELWSEMQTPLMNTLPE